MLYWESRLQKNCGDYQKWRVGKIRGTSLDDDTLELEGILCLTNIFVTHKPTKMAKDFFWSVIKQKVGVGSPRDPDKNNCSVIRARARVDSK